MPSEQFLSGSALEIAPRLLGATIRHGGVALRLSEVEAYAGADDPGSHAFRGRTPRNEVMFGPAGHLYCYFVYGMHVCANLVTGPVGEAGAVLLRAGEVVDGLEQARLRRPGVPHRELARGPARLCTTLGLTLDDNGVRPIVELAPEQVGPVMTGPRVGLRLAADRPWRFWIEGDPTVSSYRPAKPR